MTTTQKWARQCSATNEGMNEGYCVGDGIKYFKYEKDLISYLREGQDEETAKLSDEFILNESYALEEYYWTEWDDEDDFQYIERDGVLVDIDEVSSADNGSPEGLEWYDGGDGVEFEIWKDNKGIQYRVPIEIVRDFNNMEIN